MPDSHLCDSIAAMLTGLPALETFDWSRLHHAYGPATDTPAHLRALVEGDPEARDKAMAHLWSAILHQGTPSITQIKGAISARKVC